MSVEMFEREVLGVYMVVMGKVEKEGPFCSCAMYAQYGQCIHRELLKLHLEDNDVHCEFEQCGTQFGEDMKIEVAPGLSPPPKRRRQSDRMDPFRSSSSKVAPWPSSQSSVKEGDHRFNQAHNFRERLVLDANDSLSHEFIKQMK
ncbi:hypothetical protein FOZ62_013305 [Perkinsus olseni]|uniref:SWIM-type domain-containing protein n=1 Tax=Perkinsus olseni TaxID=32597 RepID=A0A7J6T5M4_PEROL|nr:hypothetical protein FOZ62_013305 [Perkinsus olseni]